MSIDNKILMLGLPETGKTSFLAAFVHYVDAQIAGKRLSQYKLSSNTTYITSIHQSWLKGSKPERTKTTATRNKNTVAEVYLHDTVTGNKLTLHIQDNFGESFETQFNYRVLDVGYVSEMKNCAGILLFIHPESIDYPILIEDLQPARAVEALMNDLLSSGEKTNGEGEGDGKATSIESDEIAPFNIEETPTQLVLVDLVESHLEFILAKPINLAVIVSAWDTVKSAVEGLSPLKWIEINLPLFYQFLVTNDEKINYKCFGVSAQGGNIEDPKVVELLRSFHEPIDRVIVQEDNLVHKNIASPVEWILNQWQAIIA